ncbi:MAG: helix-turn-helix transcriptional regulator [Actinobacteria bacterium]|nr:helix-turn-helix transcriptional regulator [Actinomycetota bacterium]
MRSALTAQDVGAVYRLLGAYGYSQRAIGELTGHEQPEVSAIVNGRRVISRAVLARIANGLGIPPGLLGVAWCTHPHCDASDGEPSRSAPAGMDASYVAAWPGLGRDAGQDR